MAKRKSNRAARRLLWVPISGYGDCFKISNRRWQVYSANYPHAWQHVKSSRSQKREKRLVEEMRIERHFWMNVNTGMSDNEAYAAAVKTVKAEAQEKAQ
ncbi:TPA: hypothetical protein ACXNHL_002704 [Serratia marcescens]